MVLLPGRLVMTTNASVGIQTQSPAYHALRELGPTLGALAFGRVATEFDARC
jgi:hypothetical protein